MDIKNEEDLANLLGTAFARYANLVQNGLVQPYKKFLEGAETVKVVVNLKGGVITVEAIEESKPEPPREMETTVTWVKPDQIGDDITGVGNT